MRILFLMKHAGYVRNFESTLYALAERGHELELAFEGAKKMQEGQGIVVALRERYPTVSLSAAPRSSRRDREQAGTRLARLGIDYLRYLEPPYAEAEALRDRARRQAPPWVVRLSAWPGMRSPLAVRALRRALQAVERRVPPPAEVERFVAAAAPDVLLVTPLVGLGSTQADFVRAAHRQGIRTGLLVHSWDNLSNKGLMRDAPGLVAVWNDAQAREAIEMHGVPPRRVAVTGANAYDHWFTWSPSRTREEVCAAAGLRADRPYVLYVCSSPFIAPDEVSFVRRWVGELRAAGGPLGDVGVLVRPHPQNAEQWLRDDLADLEQVTLWPRAGAEPMSTEPRSDYFDSIHHSAGVVGINTSAQIESAIVGRPVYTIVTDEFRDRQTGTRHFHHLLSAGDGLLTVATTFPEHLEHLRAGLKADGRARADRFLEAFIRPYGLEESATPRLVAAVEGLAASPAATSSVPRGSRAASGLVRLLARRPNRPTALPSGREAPAGERG